MIQFGGPFRIIGQERQDSMPNLQSEQSWNRFTIGLRSILSLLTLLSLILTFAVSKGQANSIGLNIYGISYHFLEPYQNREYLNEINQGLGIRASFGRCSTGTYFIEGGFFKDTFKNRAKYLSTGYMFRLLKQFRIGLHAGIYKTNSINWGRGVIAVVPIASYTVKFVTLNTVYLPKYEGVNAFHTLAGYLTIHLIYGEPKKRP